MDFGEYKWKRIHSGNPFIYVLTMDIKGVFEFEIKHVLVSSSRFIWIPMLWVHCYYNYFYSAEIDFKCDVYRRQIQIFY